MAVDRAVWSRTAGGQKREHLNWIYMASELRVSSRFVYFWATSPRTQFSYWHWARPNWAAESLTCLNSKPLGLGTERFCCSIIKNELLSVLLFSVIDSWCCYLDFYSYNFTKRPNHLRIYRFHGNHSGVKRRRGMYDFPYYHHVIQLSQSIRASAEPWLITSCNVNRSIGACSSRLPLTTSIHIPLPHFS